MAQLGLAMTSPNLAVQSISLQLLQLLLQHLPSIPFLFLIPIRFKDSIALIVLYNVPPVHVCTVYCTIDAIDVSADAVCTNLPQVLRHTLDLFSKQAVRPIAGSSRALVQSRHQQSSGSVSVSPSRAAPSATTKSSSSSAASTPTPTRVLGAHEHEVALASLVRRTALLRLLERLLSLAAQQLPRDGDRTRAAHAGGHSDADADADADTAADPRTWLTVRFDDPLAPPACARVHAAASASPLASFSRFVNYILLSSTYRIY